MVAKSTHYFKNNWAAYASIGLGIALGYRKWGMESTWGHARGASTLGDSQCLGPMKMNLTWMVGLVPQCKLDIRKLLVLNCHKMSIWPMSLIHQCC